MFRVMCVLIALAAFASVASAQRQLPLSPGVMPGSSIGPGTQFLPQPVPRFVPLGRGFGTTVMVRPNTGFVLNARNLAYRPGFYGGFYGGYGYGYGYGGYGASNNYYIFPEDYGTILPALPPEPNVVLANEFPATLTIQLPPGKEMQVNGKAVDDTPQGYTLTSPVLKPGEKYTFRVDVRWTSGGKTYEAKRAVTLGPGDRSRLLIVSGEEVKE